MTLSESQEQPLAKPSSAPAWVQSIVKIIELIPPPMKETIAVFRRSLENATRGVHITEELQNDEQKDWKIEECDDGIAQICLNIKQRVYRAFKPVILQLDAGFVDAFGRRFDEVEDEWDAVLVSGDHWAQLIKLLPHIADEAIDMITALALRYAMEWDSADEIPKVSDIPEQQKRNGIQQFLTTCDDLTEEGDRAFLQEILGEKHFKRWSSRWEGDIGAMVRRLWTICGRSERVRNRLLRLLEDTLRSSEKLLIGASVRQGWKYLLEARGAISLPQAKKVQAVIDDLHEKILVERLAIHVITNMTEELKVHTLSTGERDDCTPMESPQENPTMIPTNASVVQVIPVTGMTVDEKEPHTEESGRLFLGEDEICELESQLRRASSVFGEYFMEGMDPVAVHSLAEVVCWKEWKEQLSRAACEGDEFKISLIYKQIAHAVFRAVSEYFVCRVEGEEEHEPAFVRGFPVHVVEHQQTSCFSGAWLMAALLAKCGIPLKDMRFALVHQDSDGLIGAHGQVLLLTPWKEVIILDHGHGVCGREFKLSLCRTAQMELQMEALVSGKSTEPVVVHIEPDTAEILGYPRAMVVMPILDGIASRHILHVGIEFLEQGRLCEAQKAMQISLDFSRRTNPDALFYIGIIHARRGKTTHAKMCFKQALKIFSLHIRSHHALGKVALMEGNHEEAYERFMRVVNIARFYSVWGDNDFIQEALEYIQQHPAQKKSIPVLNYNI